MRTMQAEHTCSPPIAARAAEVIAKVHLSPKVRWQHYLSGTALALVAMLAQPSVAQAIGQDAAACSGSGHGTALLVRIEGLKERSGLLRVSTYVASDADWLVKGRTVRRIDIVVPATGEPEVCVALPKSGRYGVAVLHDRNGDHKVNIFKDGGGFSNNPKFGWSKPDAKAVEFAAGPGLTTVDIRLKYL